MSKNLSYLSANFKLATVISEKTTTLSMQTFLPFVTTDYLPYTKQFFQQHLPSVLQTICFNEENQPFTKEIKATELGHLFEHILLEQLCLLKLAYGKKESMYRGVTSWNWEKNPYGMFTIHIVIGAKDTLLLTLAMEKTIMLMEKLFETNRALGNPSRSPIARL